MASLHLDAPLCRQVSQRQGEKCSIPADKPPATCDLTMQNIFEDF